MEKKALIVVDYTVDFVADDGKLTCGKAAQAIEDAIVKRINDAVEAGDEIYVCNDLHEENDPTHPESTLFPPHNIRGTAGRELYGAVKTAVGEALSAAPERGICSTKRSIARLRVHRCTRCCRSKISTRCCSAASAPISACCIPPSTPITSAIKSLSLPMRSHRLIRRDMRMRWGISRTRWV